MTDILTRAKDALNGITEGPWSVEYKHGDTRLIQNGECTMCDMTYYPWTPDNLRDWEFFAAAPDLVRDLMAEVTRLRKDAIKDKARVEELEADLARAVGAMTDVSDRSMKTYRARNGRDCTIEASDGEACEIVHSDAMFGLRAALKALKGGAE